MLVCVSVQGLKYKRECTPQHKIKIHSIILILKSLPNIKFNIRGCHGGECEYYNLQGYDTV